MSLMAAIDTAVRFQLPRDKPASVLPYSTIMRVATNASPPGFGFDESTMLEFLQGVALRLKVDTPALQYDFARTDTQKCLNASLLTLIGLIASDTTLVEGRV